jgi:hypothetical protein
MFAASFIFHAWSNDISSGTADPYLDKYFSAVPLGRDCLYEEPYTRHGATNTRYCTPGVVMHGHPAIGKIYTSWGRGVAPSRSIGNGTPPKITMQQSDFTIALSTFFTSSTQAWGQGNCCRGFYPTAYPLYCQSFTYARFVNAAGSFFKNGGAAAGAGYNNRTLTTTMAQGTWRIRAGKNAFGGAMALLGKYGANVWRGSTYSYGGSWHAISSWPMVPPLGRPLYNTIIGYTTTGGKLYQNPYSKTNKWYWLSGTLPATTITAVGSGTLWTTGQVGVIALTGNYYTSLWRTGYDNRTAGGKGNIQLVTPTLTHWPNWHNHTAQTGILTIQVPEPGAVLLLAAGAGVLAVLQRTSRRG